ncbi:MAG: GFA family protein [Rubrivivax sp.]|nr:MAG: GFA family protein [Rubrivivax sp.]
MDAPDKQLKGGCLCGAVEYSVPDAFEYARFCHCSECRRFSGSAFSAFGGLPKASFKVTKGADSIKHYAKSEQSVLGFCEHCGSSLYADKPLRGMLHLRLGTLRDAPSLKPRSHVFVGSKAPWFDIKDGLAQYEGSSTGPCLIEETQA